MGEYLHEIGEPSGRLHVCSVQAVAVRESGMSWTNAADTEAGGDDDDESRTKRRQKGWRSMRYAGSDTRKQNVCEVMWYTSPLDYLWRTIQCMDTAGNALLDAVYPPTSPFKACSVQLCSMLEGDPTEGYSGALFYHFCEEDERQQLDMIERLRGKVMHMDAHLGI